MYGKGNSQEITAFADSFPVKLLNVATFEAIFSVAFRL